MVDFDQEAVKESVTVRLIRMLLDMTEDQQLSLLNQLEEASFADQSTSDRDDNRKSFMETIYFTLKGRSYEGISEDISTGGMFIRTEGAFSVGQTIIVTIPLAKKRKQIKVPAEVVRVMPEGIGVEFLKRMG